MSPNEVDDVYAQGGSVNETEPAPLAEAAESPTVYRPRRHKARPEGGADRRANLPLTAAAPIAFDKFAADNGFDVDAYRKAREALNLAAEFEAAGITGWAEADEHGNTIINTPATPTPDSDEGLNLDS